MHRGKRRFFRPAGAADPERSNRDDDGDTWGDVFAELTAQGHRHGDCLDYTLAQLRGHLAAIRRLRARETVLHFHAARTAAHGDADAVRAFLNALDGRHVSRRPYDDNDLQAAMAATAKDADG